MKTIDLGRGRTLTVPWTVADRLAAWWNPKAGLERLQARASMSAIGGWNGGKRDRRGTRNYRPKNTSANEDIAHDLPDLRARSRDLVRNVPIATGAVNTVVTSVVGDGLVLKSQIDRDVLGLTQEQADAWQAAAEREFAIWAKRPDFTSRQNFDGLLQLILRAELESGDVLIVRRRRFDRSDVYGLKLQLIEGDRLSNPGQRANTLNLVDGVELDTDGVPIAYHISTHYPDDVGHSHKREWRRYEAGSSVTGVPQILHVYTQQRPDQARGVPFMAAVIEDLRLFGDYKEAEVRAAVISAMFTVFVKQPDPGDQDNPIIGATGGTTSADAKTEIELGNGAVVDLAPGEDVEFAEPKRPNPGLDAFLTAMAAQIGTALELPQELLLKRFTASYSASRAALEMAWQMFRTRRSRMAWNVCQPIYEWVITEAVASGRLSAPGYFSDPVIREAWLGSDWQGPSRIQLDPQKEAAADLIDLGMGTKTRDQIITERTGGSFAQKHAQLVKEHKAREADGLAPTPASASEALQPPASRQAAEPEDDDGAEDEDMKGMGRAVEMMAQAAVINAEAARIQADKPPAHIHLPPVQINELTLSPGSIPAPVVNVAAPNVQVAAPVVNVAAPEVHVEAAKQPVVIGEDVEVTDHDTRGRVRKMKKTYILKGSK